MPYFFSHVCVIPTATRNASGRNFLLAGIYGIWINTVMFNYSDNFSPMVFENRLRWMKMKMNWKYHRDGSLWKIYRKVSQIQASFQEILCMCKQKTENEEEKTRKKWNPADNSFKGKKKERESFVSVWKAQNHAKHG